VKAGSIDSWFFLLGTFIKDFLESLIIMFERYVNFGFITYFERKKGQNQGIAIFLAAVISPNQILPDA